MTEKTASKICVVDGCSKPRHSSWHRCQDHVREQRRSWSSSNRQRQPRVRRPSRFERQCSVEECTKPVHAKELCHSHYKTHAVRKPCSIVGCTRGLHARGLCYVHYAAALKRGEFEDKQLQGVLTPQERFARSVNVTETCRLWEGTVDCNGRGSFAIDGVSTRAHRASYEFERGPIPTDDEDKTLHLDHGCRRPLCVRTDHLEPVTAEENMRRQGVAYGRESFDQRDGWLFLAISIWQKEGADNFPSCVVSAAS